MRVAAAGPGPGLVWWYVAASQERAQAPRASPFLLGLPSNRYDFVEVMACPGGCIGGGGQPRSTDKLILGKRQAAMYNLDERAVIRRSHENPQIAELYQRWLEKPNSHLAHEKLHTHYVPGGVGDDK
jgi:hypothetical protein